MFAFLKRDAKRAVASVAPKAVLKAVPGGETKRQVMVFRDITAIPEYRSVLTASGPLAVKEAQQQCVAALSRNNKEALLLATEDYRKSNEYLSLRQRLASAYGTVKEAYATPAVLLGLYVGRTQQVDRQDGDDALSVTIFRRVVEDAIERRASDIHVVLMRGSDTAVVLCRIDGTIRLVERIPMDKAWSAVGVAYSKMAEEGSSSDTTFMRNQLQTAAIPFPDKDAPTHKLRWQSFPVAGGFRVVLRVLQTTEPQAGEALTLEMQGYQPDQVRSLMSAARRTKGLVLVAGATGSGKTTLLKSMMTSSPSRHERIQYSVENPVEYKMFGVGQIDVSGSANADVNKLMHQAGLAVLRGDPDELMVGEIREPQMASLCKTMVLSGHMIYTTIHGSSGIESISRICSPEIGIPRDVLDGRNFINALVYQALIAKLCEVCRIPASRATEEQFPDALKAVMREKFKLDPDSMFVTNHEGCECCDRGVSGRTAIAEVIRPDQHMRKLFREGFDGQAEAYWRATRFAGFNESDCTGKTFVEHGLYKVARGMVDPVALDVIEPLEDYEVYPMKGEVA